MSNFINSIVSKAESRLRKTVDYCVSGVWSDTRDNWLVSFIKTINLSVRAFLSSDIQTKACAMTYRTTLAIVPALALIFAIGKGFGLQNVLRDELAAGVPSQSDLLDRLFTLVDSYLGQASGGIFVGIGVVLLLWTLVSLLSSVESAFNDIWGVSQGRSFWRKASDYLAIFILLPVLMICASGITVFVSTAVEKVFPEDFVTPTLTIMLNVASLVLIWLFFTGVYMLVPNTKVKFKHALVSGVFAGTAFIILQWLFISGQIYVSKYNAIYGSFAFLPLLLIWLQLVWVICLAGGVICYASQNVFRYSFSTDASRISTSYKLKITVAVVAVVVRDYLERGSSDDETSISLKYALPPRLVAGIVDMLVKSKLLLKVVTDSKNDTYGYAPAIDPAILTVGDVINNVRSYGSSGFIPGFDLHFADTVKALDQAEQQMTEGEISKMLVKDLKIADIVLNAKS